MTAYSVMCLLFLSMVQILCIFSNYHFLHVSSNRNRRIWFCPIFTAWQALISKLILNWNFIKENPILQNDYWACITVAFALWSPILFFISYKVMLEKRLNTQREFIWGSLLVSPYASNAETFLWHLSNLKIELQF